MTGKLSGFSTVLLIAGLAAIHLLTGCESSTTDANITVSPSSETRTAGSDSHILFTASGSTNLYLPLEWSVSNESLGHIVESRGDEAVYESTGTPGDNIITVRDQGVSEGVAVVYWK